MKRKTYTAAYNPPQAEWMKPLTIVWRINVKIFERQ